MTNRRFTTDSKLCAGTRIEKVKI